MYKNGQMRKYVIGSIIIFLTLTLGMLIYAGSRPDTVYINHMLQSLAGQPFFDCLRHFFESSNFPQWIIYILPDAMWMMALTITILLIWDFKLDKRSFTWITIALMVGFMFELGQALRWINGTFDIRDLIGMGIGALIPVMVIWLKTRR